MAKVTIVRTRIDVLDVEGNKSLDEQLLSAEGTSYACRIDFVAHNEGITETLWGADPIDILEALQEMMK